MVGRLPRAPLWLLLLAASHMSLGIWLGFEDGDFGLLYLALPFIGLTALAAWLVSLRREWAHACTVVLTSLLLALALFLVPAYLIGLYHLPQAIAALVITARAKP